MKQRVAVAATAVLALLMVPTLALADAPMPGKNLWDWVSQNIIGAFPVILAVVSLFYLIKRAFAQFIGFAVFAALVAVFVYSPGLVQAFGQRMGEVLLK